MKWERGVCEDGSVFYHFDTDVTWISVYKERGESLFRFIVESPDGSYGSYILSDKQYKTLAAAKRAALKHVLKRVLKDFRATVRVYERALEKVK